MSFSGQPRRPQPSAPLPDLSYCQPTSPASPARCQLLSAGSASSRSPAVSRLSARLGEPARLSAGWLAATVVGLGEDPINRQAMVSLPVCEDGEWAGAHRSRQSKNPDRLSLGCSAVLGTAIRLAQRRLVADRTICGTLARLLALCGLNEGLSKLRIEQHRLGHRSTAEVRAGVVEEGSALGQVRVARSVALGFLMRLDPTRWTTLPRAPVDPCEIPTS